MTNEEIMAAIPGLDETETERIRHARNIYGGGEISLRSGMCIPAYCIYGRYYQTVVCRYGADNRIFLNGELSCCAYRSAGNVLQNAYKDKNCQGQQILYRYD